MNKLTLFPAIARRLGDFILDGIVGTMLSGNIIYDTNLVAEANNQMKGFQLYCYQGVGFNQARTVTANSINSMSITVTPTFGTIPTIGDKYYLTKRFGWDDYSSAIDEAVRRARFLNLIPYSATMGLVATQYEYSVPSGFKYIHELQLVPSGSTDYEMKNACPLDRRAWSISRNPLGTYTVYFDVRFFDPEWNDADMLLVRGQRAPMELSTPTANSEVDADFLIAHASTILANRLIDEGQAWLQRFLAYKMEADKLESAIFSYPKASAAGIYYE